MYLALPLLLMVILGMSALVILIAHLTFRIGYKKASVINQQLWQAQTEEVKKQSLAQQRVVIKGKVSEQLAPYFPDFPFRPSECRFLGSPIDLVVFQGMDQGKIESIYLIDVKTDQAQLSPLQREIARAVQEKRVFWYTYQLNLSQSAPYINQPFTGAPSVEENFALDMNQVFSEPEIFR